MIFKLTALMVVACIVDVAMRRAPAAWRHLLWTVALLAALILPAGNWFAPRIASGALLIRTEVVSGALAAPFEIPWLLWIYLFGVSILLLRLLIDILAANRLVQRAHATSLPGVLLSDTAVVPFAWGRIVVPCGMQNRDAVIAHEAAHLERGDVWTSIMARVACAIYWFHPLVWWGASRMRLEADRACDDAVLQAGFSDAHYAQDLVEVARTFSTSRLAPGAIQESQVAIRVRHILSTGVDRRRLGTGAACVAVIAGALVFSPLAALSKGTSALDPNDKVYKVASGIAAPSVLYKIDPQYSEDARKLKLSGSVLLKVVVGKDGIAHDIKVVRPLIAGLDANAVAAVKRWKFRPGIKNGEAVNVSATIEVNFRLK